MSTLGAIKMPEDFRYRDVFLKGKPKHDMYDAFRVRHPRMDANRRAKIFAPFDALRGFSAAVIAKDVRYEEKPQLSEEDTAELNRRLSILRDLTWNSRMARANRVQVSVTYYEPCRDEDNTAYGVRGLNRTVTGTCWNVDAEAGQAILVDGLRISFDDLIWIDGSEDLFGKDRKDLWD